jgi:hypothetical protein
MRTLGLAALAPAVAAIVLAPFAACSKDEGSQFCATKAACGADASSPGDDGSLFGVDHGAPKGLAVDPSNPSLQVTDTTNLPSLQLSAQITYGDGTTIGVPASWTVDRIDIASVGAGNGLVQPTGQVYGRATVTAKAQGLAASTTVTVTAKATVNIDGIGAADGALLAASSAADPAVMYLDYPYDGTVFPRGLVPPEIMWDLGLAGDEYMLRLVAPYLDLSVLLTADPPSRFTMPQALWNTFVGSAAGSDAKIELHRLSSGKAYLSARQTWHVADADLRGLVYFWNVSQGQLLKADLTIGQVSPVFSAGSSQAICGSAPCGSGNPRALNSGLPATPPWEDNGVGNRCVACHSVSKNGAKLAGVFSKGGSSGPLGFVDLQTTLIDSIGDYTASGMMTAITPDGALAVMNTNDKHAHLVDATSGATIAGGLDALGNVCDPMFSADGKHFAIAANCTGGTNFVLEFSHSDLVLYDFDQPSQTFANARTIVASGAAGSALAFPSLTPDAKWLVFQGGDYSRAKYGSQQHGSDDLYVAAAQPGATPVALDAANGKSVLPPDSAHLNYAPTVSPIVAGGYYWVVFTSPRDYGNRMVSPEQAPPNDATYANHKQLWVTAIDTAVGAGATDPSHPAFWLPGQDPNAANMFGYWTLAPCKDTLNDAGPSTCQSGFECCSGFCRDTGQGFVCTNNPAGCSQVGEKCASDADCCGAGQSLGCIAGICQSTAK